MQWHRVNADSIRPGNVITIPFDNVADDTTQVRTVIVKNRPHNHKTVVIGHDTGSFECDETMLIEVYR